jgi:hypothetical protein
MELSLEELRSKLDAALREIFGTDAYDSSLYYVCETFPDYVIARGPGADLYRISYSVNDAGEISFGDPQEVEVAYVPVSEAVSFIVTEANGPLLNDGFTWPVQIIQEGFGHGLVEGEDVPHYFSAEVVQEFANLVNDARFGRRHPAPGEVPSDPARIAGWFSEGQVTTLASGKKAAIAKLNLFPNETELRDKLVAAHKSGKLDLFGQSINAVLAFTHGVVEATKCLIAKKVAKLWSVDMVTEAGAGGKFLNPLHVTAAASMIGEIAALQRRAIKPQQKNSGSAPSAGRTGAQMKEKIRKVLEALKNRDANRAAELMTKLETLADDKQVDFLIEVTEALSSAPTPAATQTTQDPTILAQAQEALAQAKRIQFNATLEQKLTDSKLAEPGKKLVREHFAAQVGDDAAIDARIASVREALASVSQIGRVAAPQIALLLDSADKVQLAMDVMLNVKESLGKGVKGFRGPREAYSFVTGDTELRGIDGGGFYKVSEAIATTNFANLLLNSMTKRAIQDYAEVGMGGLDQLITTGAPINDYKTQDRVRDGYFADLATVAENGPYTEFAYPTDEKISYAVGKYGNLLTISEETIRNDDLGKISRFPQKVARAARRTLKQFITNFFINNPNFDPDGVAWFHATHANLGANPLSIDELIAREVALMKQTEKDSGKRLGFRLTWIMVPVDLYAQAMKINSQEFYNPGVGIQEGNPFYRRFGVNGERIIINELLLDTNDWFCGTDSSNVPFLEVGYLDGISEPQIFIDNQPASGSVAFTNDQIRYKVKMVFGGDVIDFRSVQKNVVP